MPDFIFSPVFEHILFILSGYLAAICLFAVADLLKKHPDKRSVKLPDRKVLRLKDYKRLRRGK